MLNYCLTTIEKKSFLTWYLDNIPETWSFNGNSVNRQRNKPLWPVCFVFPVKTPWKFDPFHAHMQVNKTKFERNNSLEY